MNLSQPPFPGGKEGAQTFFYPEGSLVGASTVGGETQAVDRSPCAFGDPEAPPEASSWAFFRLEGDLQKPEGYVAHFSLDANAEQGDPFPRAGRSVALSCASRRPGWPRTGSKRKSRAFGNEAPAPPDAGRPSLPSSTRSNQTGLERQQTQTPGSWQRGRSGYRGRLYRAPLWRAPQ